MRNIFPKAWGTVLCPSLIYKHLNRGDSIPLSPHTLKSSQNSVDWMIRENVQAAGKAWVWTDDGAKSNQLYTESRSFERDSFCLENMIWGGFVNAMCTLG